MNANPHKECCLKLLKTLDAIKNQDSLLTTSQIIELASDNLCTNKSRIRTSIRELVRFGYLYKKARKYKIFDKNYNKAHKKISNFENTEYNIDQLFGKLPKSEMINRKELNKIYHDYSIPQIDQILTRLYQRALVEKVGGPKSRGKYYVKKDLNDTIFFTNPISEIVKIQGDDIIFCYHTALDILGLSRYAMSNEIYINKKISHLPALSKQFTIKPIKILESEIGIQKIKYGQIDVYTTNLQRTIVDCIHKPKYAIGWENVVYALNKIEKLNEVDLLIYLKKLRTPSLYAKVGYVLEQFKEKWKISNITLIELKQMKTRNPVRFFRNQPGTFNSNWNLYIPHNLLEL